MLWFEGVEITQGDFSLRCEAKVEAGSRVALIGPSGAGKSTLLNALAGFVPLDRGRISWEGRDLVGLAPHERPVSFLFQDNNLFPHLSVQDNVALAADPRLKLDTAAWGRVEASLERVGLGGMGARKPARLSGGQQSRVALARLFLSGGPIVALDEPFAALGPGLKGEMMELLRGVLSEIGGTMLMVTHEPQDARVIADQVMLVADGNARAPVGVDEIFAEPPEALRLYLGG